MDNVKKNIDRINEDLNKIYNIKDNKENVEILSNLSYIVNVLVLNIIKNQESKKDDR